MEGQNITSIAEDTVNPRFFVPTPERTPATPDGRCLSMLIPTYFVLLLTG